jgi:hypothetical protein
LDKCSRLGRPTSLTRAACRRSAGHWSRLACPRQGVVGGPRGRLSRYPSPECGAHGVGLGSGRGPSL